MWSLSGWLGWRGLVHWSYGRSSMVGKGTTMSCSEIIVQDEFGASASMIVRVAYDDLIL